MYLILSFLKILIYFVFERQVIELGRQTYTEKELPSTGHSINGQLHLGLVQFKARIWGFPGGPQMGGRALGHEILSGTSREDK